MSILVGILASIKETLPDWPEWCVSHEIHNVSYFLCLHISHSRTLSFSLFVFRALDVLLIMTALLITTIFVTSFFTPDDERKDLDKSTYVKSHHAEIHASFNSFRRQYLAVYLVIMLADWMQGTHMYTLYLSYNVNISALFLTGFLSGAIFAPFLGSAVDKFGRKRSCIVYCVLEIIINVMEHSTNFQLLLLGRVLGGVSTNLLFSAFESWMTTEHRHRGFPEEWLTRTYAEVCIHVCNVYLYRDLNFTLFCFHYRLRLEMDSWRFWLALSLKSWRII